jgi:hypothetical protein
MDSDHFCCGSANDAAAGKALPSTDSDWKVAAAAEIAYLAGVVCREAGI